MKLLFLLLLTWNVISFLIMGIDKFKAKHNKQRISEKNLLLCSLLMGSVGIGFGMMTFRHKTQKMKFKVLVPVTFIINAAAVYALFYYNIV